MTNRRGMTIVEVILSLTITGLVLSSFYAALTSGQAAFLTSEAAFHSQDVARSAIAAIQQDLSGAQIYTYYDGDQGGAGGGKVFVKFRRLPDRSVGALVDANGDPNWTPTTPWPIWMYLWCPQGVDGPPWGAVNACAQVQPTPPASGELLLVRNDPSSNPMGLSVLPWQRVRTLAWNLASAEGLSIAVTDAAGDRMHSEIDGNPNEPGELGFHPRRVDITLQTVPEASGVVRGGTTVVSTVRSRIWLRNPQ